MAELLQGKNKILLFRRLADETNENAIKLVFQTGHTFTMSREIDKVNTKDGSINKIGNLETEVSIEAIQAKTDPVGDMLRQSVIDGDTLELWEVTIDDELKVDDKYPTVYAQGNLDQWEWTADVDDEATISSTFFVNLNPQFGYAALTEGQENAVQYAFRDTLALSEAGEGDDGGGVEG